MNIRTYPKPPALGNAWANACLRAYIGRACQQRDGATLPIRIVKQALHVNQCAVRKPVCRAGVIDRLCRQSMRCTVPDLADSGCGAHEAIRASHSTTGAKYEACNLKKVDAWNSARTGAICREPAPGCRGISAAHLCFRQKPSIITRGLWQNVVLSARWQIFGLAAAQSHSL